MEPRATAMPYQYSDPKDSFLWSLRPESAVPVNNQIDTQIPAILLAKFNKHYNIPMTIFSTKKYRVVVIGMKWFWYVWALI